MNNYYLSGILCLLMGYYCQNSYGQSSFLTNQFTNSSPSGCVNNYGAGCPMDASAGGSFIMIAAVNAAGDNFFRFKDTGSNDREPLTNGDIIPTNQATPFTNIQSGNSNAFKITGANTAYRYVFKVDANINTIALFEIQGTAIRTVTNVSQSPSTVYPGQATTITATLDGGFATGQAAYLRYTTDAFATSTVVKMTASGTSYTAAIPALINTAGNTINYYVFTSGDVTSIAATNVDLYTINLNNNSGSNYSYTVANAWENSSTGNWNDPSTWLGGVVPPNNQPVIIRNGNQVTVDGDISISSLTIDAGGTLITGDGTARTITINANGSITNNGTYTSNNESINCEGDCTLSGSINLNNISTVGGVIFGGSSTINGTFTINTGGSAFDPPTYSSTSTLHYNTGGTFNRNAEWLTTTGAGYPNHVHISNNTTFQLANGSNDARQIAGNLLIDNGSSFSMEAMTGAFNVLGNLTNNGALSLSSNAGGDLMLAGDWNKGNAATFNPNGRAVTFNGTTTQLVTVTDGGTENFDYFIVDNSAANVQLNSVPATNVTVNAASSDVLQLLNGGIDLNGNTMTLTTSGGNILADGAARTITGSTGSTLRVTCNSSSICKTVTSSNGGSFTLDTDVTLELEDGGINFGFGLSNLNGIFEIKAGGFVDGNSPIYGNSSLLRYDIGSSFDRRIEWNDASLQDVTIIAGTTLVFGNEAPTVRRSMRGNLTIEGTLEMSGLSTNLSDSLTVGGNVNIVAGGVVNLSNDVGGDLKMKGDFTNDGTFNCNERAVFMEGSNLQQISGTNDVTIDFLHIVNSGDGISLQRIVNVDNELHLTDGTVTTSTSNLLIMLENAVMGAGATGSTGSYVNGPMMKRTNSTTSFTFPTGKNAILAQIGISPQSTDATEFTAEYFNDNPAPTYDKNSLALTIRHVSEIEYWQLDRSTSGTPSDARVTLHWGNHSDVSSNATDHNALKVARWDGSLWDDEGANSIVTGVPGSVTSDVISTFSPFTLATTIEDNPLPITLLDFRAERQANNQVKLSWETLREINHDYFVIERAKDGDNFQAIGRVQGQGNSNSLQAYELLDYEPYQGINYYRLKDVASDGSVHYSRIVSVFIEGDRGLDLAIYPNPNQGEATLEIWTATTGIHQIRIYDMAGKQVFQQEIIISDQLWEVQLQFPNLVAGVYLIQINNSRKSRTRRFLKQ